MIELNAAKKLLVAALVLELLGYMASGLLAQSAPGVPALTQLSGFTKSLTQQTNNIPGDLNYTVISTTPVSGALSFTNALNYIGTYIGIAVNYLVRFLLVIFTLIYIIVDGMLMIVFLLTIFLPEIFVEVNLGEFAFLFGAAEAVIDPLLAIYLFSVLRAIISGIEGAAGKAAMMAVRK